MIVYIKKKKKETLKGSTILHPKCEVHMISGYNINTQKITAFLYTDTKEIQTEIKNTASSIVAMKK